VHVEEIIDPPEIENCAGVVFGDLVSGLVMGESSE
jgi:hypothetical protein